jgi:hypothetical protein
MNKRFVFLIVSCAFLSQAKPQSPSSKIDTVAVEILDKMSAMIGSLNSCSVTVKANYDVASKQLGLVKHSDDQELFLHGPDKLLVRSEGDKGSKSLCYNGKTLIYYSMDRNQYGQIAVPASIMQMIDTVNKLYGIEFPAADIFYPSFVDDILSETKTLSYLGLTKINGMECFHIAGTARDKTFQFWVANDAFYLPLKMVIIYTTKEMNPQYEATLSDWKINPELPDALFDFSAPPKAKKIKLAPLTVKK